MAVLEVKDLHVSVETEQGVKQILKGVDLTIRTGETHAVMGPNGSGKSTLAYSIAGHPKYRVESGGVVTLDGEDVLAMTVDARARAGLFLAMQYPVEIPGVRVADFLRTAKTALRRRGAARCAPWIKEVRDAWRRCAWTPPFSERNVNEGFSGGEKKRNEILQLELLKPKFAVLDETDSGLDVGCAQGGLRGREPGEAEHRPRCAAHHALHAHPALHQAGLRPRLRRRQSGGGRRPRARRPPRRRGLRSISSASTGVARNDMVTTLAPALFDQVEEALKDVVDPELGVNVVDLGLIYNLGWDEDQDALVISMTLTSAGCPLTDVLEEQTAAVPGRDRGEVPHQLGVDAAVGVPSGSSTNGRDMMRALGFSI